MPEAYETLRGRMNFKLRAFAQRDQNNAKSFRKRVRQRSVHQARSGIAPESSGTVPGPARGGFWPVPRCSWPAADAPRSVLRPFCWRPGSILGASRCVSETALNAQNRPRSILHRFSMDLDLIFVDFRKIFRRISLDPPVTKAQIGISKRSRVILTARLGSCVVQWLRIACTSLEVTFGHYMLSLISLRTDKPT